MYPVIHLKETYSSLGEQHWLWKDILGYLQKKKNPQQKHAP